jgi:uncharacterized protein (TIGR02266 family)
MVFETSAEETYEDGQVIFEEGSAGDWIYVVESGAVELSKNVDGNKVVVEVVREGDIFGELAFFTKMPRTAAAKALGKTVVGLVDRAFLDTEYNRLSGAFQSILKSLSIRLKTTTETLSGKTTRREDPRIEKTLNLSFRDMDSFVKATTHNVSGTGLFIKTPKPLAVGARFMLRLDIPGMGEPAEIVSEVVWGRAETDDTVRRPVGMGVKFTDIKPADQERLKAALKKP